MRKGLAVAAAAVVDIMDEELDAAFDWVLLFINLDFYVVVGTVTPCTMFRGATVCT